MLDVMFKMMQLGLWLLERWHIYVIFGGAQSYKLRQNNPGMASGVKQIMM